eukprot:snap_masked-scaffold_20-processed-gene-5.45-mRNA-1 protein AED:1.00 eAED:1.00 QI:0/0/0/0/1/1/2/0/391
MDLSEVQGCGSHLDCPPYLFCYSNLYIPESNESRICTCQRLYGRDGPNCEQYGIGAIAMLFTSIFFIKTGSSYLLKLATRIQQVWRSEIKGNLSATTKVQSNAQTALQTLSLVRKSVKKKNFFLLKAQLLYWLFFLSLSLVVLNITYLISTVWNDGITTTERTKLTPLKNLRDAWIILFTLAYNETILQLSVSWLSIGLSSTFKHEALATYIWQRIFVARIIQLFIPVFFFVLDHIVGNIFLIAALSLPCYCILLLALYKGSSVLVMKFKEAKDEKLKLQGMYIRTCVKGLALSATMLLIADTPLGFLSYFRPPLPDLIKKSLFPPRGGINYFLLGAHIIRHSGAFVLIGAILDYFDSSSQKNMRKKSSVVKKSFLASQRASKSQQSTVGE